MTRWQSPTKLTVAAAALLLGVSSFAFAQDKETETPRNQPGSSDAAQKAEITKKLAAQGVTDVKLRPEKHGWVGTGMKNGKKVKVEVNERGQWEIK